MKKIFSKVLFLMIGMFTLSVSAQAQGMPQMPQLPADSLVRQGVLPNGLTYYIRHNETPKGQADFYIAQKVGSINEEDSQRGLAHFLEHMCFNGTENFKGNEVVSWLETKGVKFGYNLNAYTGFDETVYNISNVPVNNTAVEDSCLLILHDWADGLLLLPEEIDKERGVIHEEWRMRNVGTQRIMEKQLPVMYKDSKYGYRMPIGLMEVVDNFEPKVLRDYYETWYRPDLQGIIVVGDIDVDRIENKIKELFSPIKMPENPKTREYAEVPDTEGTIYAIDADPEQSNARATIYFKNDVLPRELRNTQVYLMTDYVTDMITSMLNSRLDELGSSADSPYAAAGSYYGNFFAANTKDALTVVALGKDGDITPALAAVYRELLRAIRGGFTASEYDRAREEYLSALEKAYNNREKTENETLVNKYVRSFIDGTPMMDIATEYDAMKQIAQQIPVEMINMAAKELISDNNRVVSIMLPEKEGMTLPTEAEVAAALAAVDGEDIAAFVDEVKAEPLIPQLPAPGKVVKKENLDKWGAEKWTLSNGATVVVKKTDFKADEIVMDAQALGGTSAISDEYNATLKFLPMAQYQHGLGDYTYKDLQKYLQGKQCSVSFSFDDYTRDINGQTTPKDLPVMMELLYMGFTNFNITADEFAATQNMMTGILHNQENTPDYIFSKVASQELYKNPRREPISTADINAASLDQTLDVIRKMTANAADYTFFFAGSIDMDTFQPLVEQYIASLPGDAATAQKAPVFPEALAIKNGEKMFSTTTPMQTPQVYVLAMEYADLPYTAEERAAAVVAGQILSQRILDKVREEWGASYSPGATASMQRISNKYNSQALAQFPMKPEMKDQVLDYLAQEFKDMASNVTPTEVGKVTEFMIKMAKEQKEKNDAWVNGMAGEALNGVDTFTVAEEVYGKLTPADVQNFMKKLNDSDTYRVILLEPAAE